MSQANKHFNHQLYHRVSSSIDGSQCIKINDYFYTALESDYTNLTKTHFFNGRYENIYLKDNTFEPLRKLLDDAKKQAALILNCQSNSLSMDYWFNHMPPKHITDWHRHDVLDEQLSSVFYIHVPEHSGNLLLKNKPHIETIIPKENDFVFFNPDIEHSVEENQSSQSRLSIGMNFGFITDKADD